MMTEKLIDKTLDKIELAYGKNNLYRQVLLASVLNHYVELDADKLLESFELENK